MMNLKNYKIFFLFYKFFVIIQQRRRSLKYFSLCNKILLNKKYFCKIFFRKHHRVMSHVMD